MRKYRRNSVKPTQISHRASAGSGTSKLPRNVQKAVKWAIADKLLDAMKTSAVGQFPEGADSLHVEQKGQSVYIIGANYRGALGLAMMDPNDGRPVFHPTFGHKPYTTQSARPIEIAILASADDCADAAADTIMQYADEIGDDTP